MLTILGQCFSLLSQPQTYLLNIMLEKAIQKKKHNLNPMILKQRFCRVSIGWSKREFGHTTPDKNLYVPLGESNTESKVLGQVSQTKG